MVSAQVLLLLALSGTSGDTVLLDFSAPWCAPCRMMDPTVQRLASAGYPVRKIDVEQHPDLAAQYRVTSVPCFVLVAGGREVDRVVGGVSYARLVQMFAAAGTASVAANTRSSAAADQPENQQIRGQSPRPDGFSLTNPWGLLGRDEPASSTPGNPPADPLSDRLGSGAHSQTRIDRAMAATVRIKVVDPSGHSYGTGTIIDVHDREALVTTCGHIFRESQGKGRIQVDLFHSGATRTVPGALISYNLQRDIALVSIVPGVPLQPAPVAPLGHKLRAGDQVFSIGCDHGQDPSIRASHITSVDKYLGPPNVEVQGEPVDGRSGGGLFSADGLLIGICNAADPTDREGIYASLPTIHSELDRIGQRRIYDGHSAGASFMAADQGAHEAVPGEPRALTGGAPVATELAAHPDRSSDTEVICIVRSKTDPQGGQQLLILDHPSAELLQWLAHESQSGQQAIAAAPHPPTRLGDRPIVRAQSAKR